MNNVRLISTMTIAAVLSACAPRAAYVGPVGTFSAQSEKLGGVVATELARFNTDRRAAYLRHDIFRRIQRDLLPGAPPYVLSGFDVYLCNPHKVASAPKDNSRYLSEVSTALNQVAETPNKETVKLLDALFKSYDIQVKPPTGAVPDGRCNADIQNYPETLFPSHRPEFSPAGIIGGAKALWQVFDTLANAALQQIDEGRRTAALKAYLSNQQNVADLRSSIDENAKFLSAAYTERRHLDVFAAIRAHTALETKLRDLDLRSIGPCQAFLAAPPDAIVQSPQFQSCFVSVSSEVEGEASALLTAAASYDESATASPEKAGEELTKTLDKLEDLAAGRLDAAAMGQMLAALANAGSAIETLIDKANDEETKKAVDGALKKIKESL